MGPFHEPGYGSSHSLAFPLPFSVYHAVQPPATLAVSSPPQNNGGSSSRASLRPPKLLQSSGDDGGEGGGGGEHRVTASMTSQNSPCSRGANTMVVNDHPCARLQLARGLFCGVASVVRGP